MYEDETAVLTQNVQIVRSVQQAQIEREKQIMALSLGEGKRLKSDSLSYSSWGIDERSGTKSVFWTLLAERNDTRGSLPG